MAQRCRPTSFAGPAALAALLLMTASAGSGRANPADPATALQSLERDLDAGKRSQRTLDERVRQLSEEMAWLRAQIVDLADETRRLEQNLADIEAQLHQLTQEEREKAGELDRQRAQMATLLGALERLSRIPPEAALARPGTPIDTLRSALILRETVPALRESAARLTQALNQLGTVRQQLEESRAMATATRQNLQSRQQQLAALVAKRESAAVQTEAERQATAQRVAKLTAQAGDLRQLMEKVEADRRNAAAAAEKREAERQDAERRLAAARQAAAIIEAQKEAARQEALKLDAERRETAEKERLRLEAEKSKEAERKIAQQSLAATRTVNGLRMPVGGPITLHYGGRDEQGANARGVTIASHPGSAVVSPSSGTIMYAGPFRNFGLILIVEHGNGYHSLLAGLGRIDVTVGRHVTAGEPLGTLPANQGDDGDGRDLYFELRRNGQPVDPERGFAEKQGKGQG